MKDSNRFSYLLDKYAAGKIDAAEHDELFELVATHQYDDILALQLQQDLTNGVENSEADLPPHIAQEIIRNIYSAEKNTARVLPLRPVKKPLWRWVAAASVLAIALSSYFIFFTAENKQHSQFASFVPAGIITKTNSTAALQVITLTDGSQVTLSPNSTLYYPSTFSAGTREVYLEGEGFFQVQKNPAKPFLVYYNNIVTKVLGTSFIINTNKTNGNVEVLVKTGRVQVFENDKLVKGGTAENSVILTPNQKAVYQVDKRLLQTALADKPELLSIKNNPAKSPITAFVYEQETLATVFNQLETAYGIDIIMENSNLGNCLFTGDVSGQDLFTKLKIICLTTNASYEINGTKVLIKGAGCN